MFVAHVVITMTVISVDAMGGDNGPSAIVAGMANAAKTNSKVRFIINGDKTVLDQLILKRKILENICEVRHTTDIISMDDKPTYAMRNGLEFTAQQSLFFGHPLITLGSILC